MPNQYQAVPPAPAKKPRLNCYGGPPGYDPTVSLTLQFPHRTDKANVFLRVRNTAEGGQACPMEDPKTPRTSQKCQKVLTMTSQGYVTTDSCCLEMSLHANVQQQKKGRPAGSKNKKADLSTPDSSNSPNEDGGSQIPTSTMYHTAPFMPPIPTSAMHHTAPIMSPLATPVAQPASRPFGYAQTTNVSEEQWGQEFLEQYHGGNTSPPNAYIYNNGSYGNYGSSSSSSSSNSYSYPNQPPVDLTGYQPYDTPALTISQGYNAPSSSLDFDNILYERLRTELSLNPDTIDQPYDTPPPTFSQRYNGPSSSIDSDNILNERLRTVSSLHQNATATAQDNSPSPFNPWARDADYMYYPDPEEFSFANGGFWTA